jgi:hypothetical protein
VLVESVTFTGDAITGAGALTMSGDLALATDKFTVASSSGNTACAGTFEVGGNKFTVDAAGAGVFASTVTASGSQLTSDARWKTNVANLTDGLDAVLALRPVRYDWGADSPAVLARGPGAPPLPKQLGFLAQEVREVLPRGGEGVVVEVDGEGHLGLAYDKLAAVLVRALQEEHVTLLHLAKDSSAVDEAQLTMIEAQQRQIEAVTVVAEKQQMHIEQQQVQNEEQQRQMQRYTVLIEEQQRQIKELQQEDDVVKGRMKRLRRLETEVGYFNEQAIRNERAFMEQDMKNELVRQQHEAMMGQIEELRLLAFGQTHI